MLVAGRLHLGVAGQTEWAEFQNEPLHGPALQHKFSAVSNAAQHCLLITQKDVKQSWQVRLNGQRLGNLTRMEEALQSAYIIPPGTLVDGENVLEVLPPPNVADDIWLGPVLHQSAPLAAHLGQARLEITVEDADAVPPGAPLPCRLTLVQAADGETLQALTAGPAGQVAAREGVVYTATGRATLSVPAGDYRLFAGRGFEWSLASQDVPGLKAGETRPLKLQLRREVDTRGWLAVDSHIHTLTHSGHGDATLDERAITIAGEGIELAIATDHNHPTDYAPAVSATRLEGFFRPVIGNEVTTRHGHFNAFPVPPGETHVDVMRDRWQELLPALRAIPGVRVITLNHPRDLHSGFTPLGPLQFNPDNGHHRDANSLHHLTALEVVTSAAMQSDVMLLFRDWFALLNAGHRIHAVGASDTHDVSRFILGQARTYVAAPDAAHPVSTADLETVWQSYEKGRLLVSLGLFTEMSVNQKYGVGDLADGLGDTVEVDIRVQGPAWTQADHVALYANGVLVKEERMQAGPAQPAGEKIRRLWRLPKPARDTWLVAVATGPGKLGPWWQIPRAYQPTRTTHTPRVLGATNPIFLDVDGDGRWTPAP